MATVTTSDLTLTTTANGGADGTLTVADASRVLRGLRGWLRDESDANPLEVEVISVDVDTFVVREIRRDASGRETQTHNIPDLSAYLTGSTVGFSAQEAESNELAPEGVIEILGVTADPEAPSEPGVIRLFYRTDTNKLCSIDHDGTVRRSGAFA